MKRLLTFILALALLLNASGQILRYSNYTLGEPPAETPDYYDEYDTVYAAFTTKPSSTVADYQEALVYSLDTCDFAGGASVWDRMDQLFVFATHDNGASEALLNWVDPGTFDADDPSTVTWDNLQGYTGNGTSTYLSTNYAPGTNAVHLAQDDATMGVYIRNNVQGNFYAAAASTNIKLMARDNDNKIYYAINSGTLSEVASITTSAGLYLITRTGANLTECYKNGTSIGSDTSVSSALTTSEIQIFRYGTTYSTYQISIFFVMDGITDAEATAINTIIETYMDAIGTGVQ